jgi:hypothetical protein
VRSRNETASRSHWSGCPDDDKVSAQNHVTFPSREAAEQAAIARQRTASKAQGNSATPLGEAVHHMGGTLYRMLSISILLCLATSSVVSAHRSGCHWCIVVPRTMGRIRVAIEGTALNAQTTNTVNTSPTNRSASSSRVSPQAPNASGEGRADRNSKVYRVPGCKGYGSMKPASVVAFATEAEAQQAGYHRAKNCP